MATLILDRSWVNLVADGTGLSGFADRDRPEDFTVSGDVRRYAGGRERSIRLRGTRRNKSIVMQSLSTADKDRLVEWAGKHVQYRDYTGRWFGVYFTGNVTPNMDRTWDVSFTLTQVTTIEGVEAL